MGTGNGSYGYMDQEILMNRNVWMQGDSFEKQEEPEFPGADGFGPGNGFLGLGWDE